MAGRIGAIVMARRRANNGQPRRRPSEEELERFKKYEDRKYTDLPKMFSTFFTTWNCNEYVSVDRVIKGYDISENSNTRLKFRKIPYPFWIIGGLFWAGALLCLYLIYLYGEENGHGLFVVKEWK